MLLSILMPVYNVEHYLDQAIQSVLDLNIDYEIIIINDGSTDNSATILEKYQNISYIRIYHQENQGIAQTRNKLLSLATAKYIHFFDSDDSLNRINYQKIITNLDHDIHVFDYQIYYLNHQKLTGKINKLTNQSTDSITFLLKTIQKNNLPLFLWNMIFKRELITKFKFSNHYFEDLHFIYQILLNKDLSLKYHDLLVINYSRQRKNQITETYSYQNIYDRIIISTQLFQIINSTNYPINIKYQLKARVATLFYSAYILAYLHPKLNNLIIKNQDIFNYHNQFYLYLINILRKLNYQKSQKLLYQLCKIFKIL